MTSDSLSHIIYLYERWGHDSYSEAVSQVAHAEQAAELARLGGSDDALIAAALLHDIGHLLVLDSTNGVSRFDSDDNHESVGARFLARCLGVEVTAPIALHVAAKRYLCLSDPAYFATLSPASVASLALQGGPMREDEALRFERSPHFSTAINLRRWDEAAKDSTAKVQPFDNYIAMMQGLAH